ncbi:MAG: hypothetical protein OXE99_02440, partial [Cellvibrionales bacterium]|nr:hypothetical protein [Cellvibrionales bacterium]
MFLKKNVGLFEFNLHNKSHLTIETTFVVGNQASPTFDYYFRARKASFPCYFELSDKEALDNSHPIWHTNNSQLIISRTVSLAFLEKLCSSAFRPDKIIWFMDDDIPGANTDKTLPRSYRLKLASWYKQASPLLAKSCDQVWVSTDYLRKKYKLPKSWVLAP